MSERFKDYNLMKAAADLARAAPKKRGITFEEVFGVDAGKTEEKLEPLEKPKKRAPIIRAGRP